METANIQSVAENNIVSVALVNIQPSDYNPRKNFDEESLAELAESIRRQGVLQPIGVRPIADTGCFEIVFGERRYRASLMAELENIPAIILNVSDETAEEMAITENLQRKDVTPIEEADAYQKLIESGRYDVQALAVQFGKSENYVRTRLKFVSLIPEIADLLERDELTVSVASAICRYSADIQREVYEKHYKEANSYNSWRGLKASEVAKYIERDFTADLSRYNFDKTLLLCSIQFITKVKTNMKNSLVNVADMISPRERALIETANDGLKDIAQTEHSRHCSLNKSIARMPRPPSPPIASLRRNPRLTLSLPMTDNHYDFTSNSR